MNQRAQDIATKQNVLKQAPVPQRLSFLAEAALLFLQVTVDPNAKTNPKAHTLFKLRSAKRKSGPNVNALVEEIQNKIEVNFAHVEPASAWSGFLSLTQEFVTQLQHTMSSEQSKTDIREVSKRIGLNSISQIVQYLCVSLFKADKEEAAEQAINAFLALPKSRRVGKPTGDQVASYSDRDGDSISDEGLYATTGTAKSQKSAVAKLQNIALKEPSNRQVWNLLAEYYRLCPELISRSSLRQRILRTIQEKGESAFALLMLGHISHDNRSFDDSALLYLRAHCLADGSSSENTHETCGNPVISICLAAALLQKAVVPRNVTPSVSITRILAWYGHYQRLRTSEAHARVVGLPLWMLKAECNYNLGRFYHHLGFINLAIRCYDSVLLAAPETAEIVIAHPELHRQNKTPSALDGDYVQISKDLWEPVSAFGTSVCHDIRMEATYNLVIILQQTKTESSLSVARRLSERFLTVDAPGRPLEYSVSASENSS
eukprot:gb/GECG01003392.1/.p1 GENE.gb/GECG01003392.1/~~gb/GECG01003392.1/.p1  ORF type:complete len:489 (+),score=52.74 gb/GECG01003392.1/:1-1467(+)